MSGFKLTFNPLELLSLLFCLLTLSEIILGHEHGVVSERGGSYDITLNITVTKTDRYRCVVEQEDIKHRITSETFVLICEKEIDNSLTKVIIGLLALGVVLLALLLLRMWITLRRRSSSRPQGNGPVDQENH